MGRRGGQRGEESAGRVGGQQGAGDEGRGCPTAVERASGPGTATGGATARPGTLWQRLGDVAADVAADMAPSPDRSSSSRTGRVR